MPKARRLTLALTATTLGFALMGSVAMAASWVANAGTSYEDGVVTLDSTGQAAGTSYEDADLEREDGSPFKNQGDCIQYANTGK